MIPHKFIRCVAMIGREHAICVLGVKSLPPPWRVRFTVAMEKTTPANACGKVQELAHTVDLVVVTCPRKREQLVAKLIKPGGRPWEPCLSRVEHFDGGQHPFLLRQTRVPGQTLTPRGVVLRLAQGSRVRLR
jgi:hypothetical protein